MQKIRETAELFFKGMNNRDKSEFLKEGYLEKCQNCLLGDNQIEKGPGSVRLFSLGTNKKILGAISTPSEIYFAANEPGDTLTFIYRYSGSGTPVAVSGANLTVNLNVEFVDTGSAVYVFNGTDTVGKLVGSTYTAMAGMPKGNWANWINNRLYILTAASRLYYSDANAPETHGGSSYIDIFPDSNSPSTGISSIGGLLMVGKRDNIISFSGFTEDDFTVKKLTEQLPNYGITSHRSIINTGDDLYFMSFAGDVPHIRSLTKTINDKLNYGGTISGAIEGTMKTLNKDRLNQVCGGFDGRFMWWSCPSGTSTTNDLTICKDTFKRDPDDGWTIHTNFNATVWLRSTITGDDRLYYGDNSQTQLLGLNKSVTLRDGVSIDFELISRKYRVQTFRKSKWKYVYVTTGESSEQDIVVSSSPDGFTYEEQAVISPSVTGSIFPMTFPFFLGSTAEKKERINLKGNTTAYSYQLKFGQQVRDTVDSAVVVFPLTFPISFGSDTASEQLAVKEWSILHYPRGLRDT